MNSEIEFDKDGYSDDKGDGPSENAVIVEDFLPPPEVMAAALKRRKITIELTEPTVEYLKEQADKHNVSYQAMIREILDDYVRRQK